MSIFNKLNKLNVSQLNVPENDYLKSPSKKSVSFAGGDDKPAFNFNKMNLRYNEANKTANNFSIPFSNLQKRVEARNISQTPEPSKSINFHKTFKHSSWIKLKEIQDKDYISEIENLIKSDNLKLLKRLPEAKHHVEDLSKWLPEIQTVHSQIHRKKMVKDWMKERLLEFAKKRDIRLYASDLQEKEERESRLPRVKLKAKSIKPEKRDKSAFDAKMLNIDNMFEGGSDQEVSSIILKRFEYEVSKHSRKQDDYEINQIKSKMKFKEGKQDTESNQRVNLNVTSMIRMTQLDKVATKFKLESEFKMYEKDFRVHWGYIKNNSYTPHTRDGATWVSEGTRAYLFGGRSYEIFNSVSMYDSTTRSWMLIEPQNKNSDKLKIPEPRYGHSMCVYENKIYILGGCSKYNKNSQRRECLYDMKYFDLSSRLWKMLPSSLRSRRYHSAVMMLNCIMVYGGIDETDYILDEMCVFNNYSETWTRHNDTYEGDFIPPLYHHTACAAIPKELNSSNKYTIYNHAEVVSDFFESKKLRVGIYIFGGLTGKVNKKGEFEEYATNGFYFLQTGKNRFTVQKIRSEGGPCPRYCHSMSFDNSNMYLVVYGGYNKYEHHQPFGDMYFYNCMDFCWFTCTFTGIEPAGRHSHSAVVLDSALLVFGGVGDKNYFSNVIYEAMFNQVTIRKSIKEESNLVRGSIMEKLDNGNKKPKLIYYENIETKNMVSAKYLNVENNKDKRKNVRRDSSFNLKKSEHDRRNSNITLNKNSTFDIGNQRDSRISVNLNKDSTLDISVDSKKDSSHKINKLGTLDVNNYDYRDSVLSKNSAVELAKNIYQENNYKLNNSDSQE